MRIRLLDGLRGYFLLLMTFFHIGPFMGNDAYRYSHHSWGFVEDAQGFVFLSGLVVGVVYSPLLLKSGMDRVRSKLLTRMRLVYVYHAVVALLLLVIVSAGSAYVDLGVFSRLGATPLRGTVMTLLLVAGPAFVDVLPVYVVFLAATPLILSQLQKGRTVEIIAASVCLWIVAQTQLIAFLLLVSNQSLGWTPETGLQLGLTFDRTAWQLVYVLGMVLGFHWTRGNIALDWFTTAQGTFLAKLALGLFLCFYVIKDHQGAAFDYFPMLRGALNRWDFSILRLANFAADAYLFTWIVVAGPASAKGWIRALANALRWVFNAEALCVLGRHSLQVFAYHTVLLYVAVSWIDWASMAPTTRAVLSTCVILSVYLAALVHASYQRRIARRATRRAKTT